MSTVGKAIALLDLFTVERPEMKLSELARLARFDKATTYRLLVVLARHGFVEQDAETRAYRLGGGLSRLARIREAHFPFLQTAVPEVRELARQTGETVHLSEYSAGTLAAVHVESSSWANRINVDVGYPLPLHSTASGIAFLAFSRFELVEEYLDGPMPAYTSRTITDAARLAEAIRVTAERGYSVSSEGHEDNCFSVAAAILGADGFAIGALSVASPLQRIDEVTIARHGKAVAAAAAIISERLNGERITAARWTEWPAERRR